LWFLITLHRFIFLLHTSCINIFDFPSKHRNFYTLGLGLFLTLDTLTSNATLNRVDFVDGCPCLFLENLRIWYAFVTWCHKLFSSYKRFLWRHLPIIIANHWNEMVEYGKFHPRLAIGELLQLYFSRKHSLHEILILKHTMHIIHSYRREII
jgi:hypothetical protein